MSVKRKTRGSFALEGAGVKIHRLIGTQELNHIDPFVLLDEFKSDNPKDYIAGFPTHPHRGIETITYMLQGSFRHKDSRGGGGVLTDGCVQWMTAGKGIQHSEMPEKTEGLLWGYQLWLSLPAANKMVEPRYQHLGPEDIPAVEKDGLIVKIISGEYDGVKGPAANWVKTDYFDIRLGKSCSFDYTIPDGINAFCYPHNGSIILENGIMSQEVHGEWVELDAGDLTIRADSDEAGCLFLAAKPNNEPIARGGPFVMNTREEIRQAFIDYQNGDLG